MAFATPESSATSALGTEGTTISVTMPSGITTGDLLIMIVGARAVSVNAVTGWTLFVDSGATQTDQRSFYRKADGTEGSSVNVGLSASGWASAVAYRFSGAADPDVRPPEGAVAFSDVDDANPDSPILTPTGGTKDYNWITTYFQRTDFAVSSYPANYTLNQVNTNGGPGDPNRIAAAIRQLNASSENPGAFTAAGAGDWSATTIAIHPAGAVGGTAGGIMLAMDHLNGGMAT